MSRKIVVVSYLALIALQWVWHAFVPAPMGMQSWILATVATLPLLLPLKGVLERKVRSMTWAGYLTILYFVIGVTEAWSNPAQRYPALVQIVLCVVFVVSLTRFTQQIRAARR